MSRNRSTFRGALALLALSISAILVPTAGAAPSTGVTASVESDVVDPGVTANFTVSINPGNKTVDGFTLTPPAGFQVGAVVSQPANGSASVTGNTLVATGLKLKPPAIGTVQFTAETGCAAASYSWTLVVRNSRGRPLTLSLATSDLTTEVVGNCHLGFVSEPNNGLVGQLITADDRDPSSTNYIRVELLNGTNVRVTHFPVTVTFDLGDDPSGGTAELSVIDEGTSNGVATFDTGLSIDTANTPGQGGYTLVPGTTPPSGIVGSPSGEFDVWASGVTCGSGDCPLDFGGDQYTGLDASAGDFLSATAVPDAAFLLNCPDYVELTGETVFTDYSGGVVFVVDHVSRTDMKVEVNNGVAHAQMCVGKTGPWGPTLDGTEADSTFIGDVEYFVGLAPACPNQSPSEFAPCIDHKTGDGNGGVFVYAYLPGGDPPRKT